MRIDIPASLTARWSTGRYDLDNAVWVEEFKVIVEFGDYEITRLPPIGTVSKWDEDSELERVAQETVANWLKEKLNG